MSSGRFPLKKILIVAVILLVSLGGFRLLVLTRPSQAPTTPKESEWPVNAEILQRGAHAPVLTLFGRVEAPHTTRLVAAVNADVLAVPAREADKVTNKQLLVQLDDREARLSLQQRAAELLEAQALLQNEQVQHASNLQTLKLEQEVLALAENELQRTLKLQQTQLASQNVIDTARQAVVNQQIAIAQRELAIASHAANLSRLQAAVNRAQAQRELAELDVARTQVKAPFPALITQVHAVPGQRVRVGDALIDLYESNFLEVRTQLPIAYLPVLRAALRNNQQLQARIATQTQTGIPDPATTPVLTLERITGDVQTNQTSVDALFRVSDHAQSLARGQVLKLWLSLPGLDNTFTVPAEAVYGDNRIFVIKDDHLQSHTVRRLGLLYDDNDEERVILHNDELVEGSAILSTQLPNAIDGLKVKVLP